MIDHDFSALGWNELVEHAKKLTFTFLGKQKISEFKNSSYWAKNLQQAQILQQETQEILDYLPRSSLWTCLLELADIHPFLVRLQKGAVLDLSELLEIKRWLEAISTWNKFSDDEFSVVKNNSIFFREAIKTINPLKAPLKLLSLLLTSNGELSENFSPKLFQLFSDIRSTKRDTSSLLDTLLKKYSQKGILQDQVIDQRDDRYVLLVKTSHQNEIEGILHEASASRQTLFIEPEEITPLNNRLRQKQNELNQEIKEILQNVSQEIAPYCFEIIQAIEIISYWDSVQAKARLALSYEGRSIQVIEERKFNIRNTAHPLLWQTLSRDQIIKNHIEFGEPTFALLITGPNTGGKTVLLKTLGIAGICAKTGFFFPAQGIPEIPFFDSFFTDLGDSQSIENQISSFSGHVLKFKLILENLTPQSLILLDELNSATDPEEGAAFGRAILEKMISKDSMVITTTHDPKLKALALSNSKIMNASMAFHEENKTPTYQLLIGVPGRSRALETAERLGISSDVIQLAKSYLSYEHKEFETLLTRLETDTQQASLMKKDAEIVLAEAEALKNKWATKTQESLSDLMNRTNQKLRKLLEQSQEEIRSVLKNLEKSQSRKEVDNKRAALNEVFNRAKKDLESSLDHESPEVASLFKPSGTPLTSASKKLSIGQSVKILKWKSLGKIIEVISEKDNSTKYKVAMGSIQMTFSPHEIEETTSSVSKKNNIQIHVDSSESISSRLDIRGLRFEEAMQRVNEYLDNAYRGRTWPEVTIIHGLGTGALREGTLKLLSQIPYVRSYRDGGTANGGTGATIVEFEKSF